ncbi:hypothetical protein [Burkholderia latens]|uniref:hypothetical protein n=1 Tax=Burkholderia latens TaxID=488446 RepID=UPI001AE20936|nr:hypothetical protein [Burkholderia latens]QTO47433.1 hypothetical protein J8I86_10375 [Burkholderia latens]
MHRAKWFKIEVDCAHKELVASIRAAQFDGDVGYGFDLSFRDESQIRARFIEKIATIETVTDPYGVSTDIETTRYSSVNFKLHSFLKSGGIYFMEISSPPRSIRTFISALSDIANGVMVSEVDVPVLEVFGNFRKNSASARLTRIKASQLKLTAESVARIDVTSIKNAASDLRRIFGDGDMSVDKIRVERPFGPATHAIELSRNGLVAVDDAFEDVASDFMLDLLMRHYREMPVEDD